MAKRQTKADRAKEREKNNRPWLSQYFDFEYDDSQEFCWKLKLKTTGRVVGAYRSKWWCQDNATMNDKMINEAIGKNHG